MRASLLFRCIIAITLFAAGISTACDGSNTNSSTPTPANTSVQTSPSPPKTGFEADLDYVRKGQYTYIWVFSRKDGKPINKDDGDYLRKNAPQVVDWVTTDEGKRVIAGTNFNLEEGNLSLLQKRFVVEDYTAR